MTRVLFLLLAISALLISGDYIVHLRAMVLVNVRVTPGLLNGRLVL